MPAGVNIPNPSGGFLNGDNQPNGIYTWNGLTLFDNADTSGTTNVNAPNYSAILPGADGLGGKFDPSLAYKFVNRSNGNILEAAAGFVELGRISGYCGGHGQHEPLPAVADLEQRRRILSNRQRERAAGRNSECPRRFRRLDERGQSRSCKRLQVRLRNRSGTLSPPETDTSISSTTSAGLSWT